MVLQRMIVGREANLILLDYGSTGLKVVKEAEREKRRGRKQTLERLGLGQE